MSASSSTLANSSLSQAVIRRLLIVWLPIIIVGALIFWLSGGVPPVSWILLIQMLMRWNGLYSSLGNALFISFAIIIVQSLFILTAWGILLFTIWREISVFNTLRTQQRVVALQQKLALAANPPAAPPPAPAVSQYQGVQLLPDFNDDDDRSEAQKSTGIQIVSPEYEEQDDAFDVNKAIFELSSDADDARTDTSSNQQQIQEEETIFLYGNPFDGDLPEVFHYDMDLKRGVQSMQEELRIQKKAVHGKEADDEDKSENE